MKLDSITFLSQLPLHIFRQFKTKMIDIASFNRSLKATWIKKYLDKENCGSWKSFFDSELEKYGGEVTLTGNLNTKESRNIIKVSDP